MRMVRSQFHCWYKIHVLLITRIILDIFLIYRPTSFCNTVGSQKYKKWNIGFQDNPEIAAKAERELLEEESDRMRANYHIYTQLRKQREQEHFEDEDIYASEQSETEASYFLRL